MSSFLTPGIAFVLNSLPQLFLPPCFVYLAKLGVVQILNVKIQPWMMSVMYILSLPVFILARAFWIYQIEEYEIKALGAIRVPVVQGRWPGNLDLLLGRLKQGEDGYPFDGLRNVTRKYGKIFNTRIMGEDRIVTTDPNHIKIILATEFNNWEKGDRLRRQLGSVFGSGVFTSDGEMWKFHRSMTRPFFSRDRVTDFEIFGRHAEDCISTIHALQGRPFDYQDLVSRFTLDSATEFLFGSCVNSSKETVSHSDGSPMKAPRGSHTFGQALFRLQRHLTQRSRLAPLWPLLEIFGDRTSKDLAIVHDFVRPIIEDALKRKQHPGPKENSTHDGEPTRQTLLDYLVDLTDDPKMIADETLNILFAARDTTASTLTFLTYFLTLDPLVLKRLRSEVMSQVGETRPPTFQDIREMKYLRAVINETLRLFPPLPGNVRTNINSTTLPPTMPGEKPFYIPARCKVPFVTMHMQRDKDLWGPDADNFDPDRFLDERLDKYLVSNPFIFLPFNAGPRICLGQQFAYNEISFFVIRLLQAFDHMELATDSQPVESLPPAGWTEGSGRKRIERIRPKSELTLYVQGGLWLRMQRENGVNPSQN